MNKVPKNIVVVGFTKKELWPPEIGKNYYFTSMKDIKNHKGFLLIVNNKENISLVDFDKLYRNKLDNFCYVWLYNEKNKNIYNKWANVELMNEYLFLVDTLNYWDLYENYELKKIEKYTKKRLENIQILNNYLKNYKRIKTSKIVEDLNLNERMIQRYMQDLNDVYHNIGYDYSLNEWYII